jgi:predicted MPP superfamily phosphohydrolase
LFAGYKLEIMFLALMLASFVLLGVMTFAYALLIEPSWLLVRHRRLPVERLNSSLNGVSFLHLSDLHIGRSNGRLMKLLRRAGRIPADYVVITGDIVDNPAGIPSVADVLGEFMASQHRPVICVLGNHDRWDYRGWRGSGVRCDANLVVDALTSMGITVLMDQVVELETARGEVAIVGLDVDSHSAAGLRTALGGRPLDSVVLLAHSPDIFEAARECGIPLVLSGHTHGGQIRLGPWLTPTTSTLYPLKPPAGVVERAPTTMHVSPGLGTALLPLRFCSRPEATIIELQTATCGGG